MVCAAGCHMALVFAIMHLWFFVALFFLFLSITFFIFSLI